MTILPRVASIRASKVSRKNVDDYDIREYDAMTDGSVRGGYEWRNRGVGVGKHRVCEPGRPSIS